MTARFYLTTAIDYANVPTAVFTLPPVAVVGRTEAAARAERLSAPLEGER